MNKITFVNFLWHDEKTRKKKSAMRYSAESVNIAYNMISRNVTIPWEMVCATDIPEGINPAVRTVPIDPKLKVPGRRFQKLMVFRRDAEALFGKRIFMFDLDTVFIGNIDHIVSRTEPLVLWLNPRWAKLENREKGTSKFNSSFVLLDAGARPEVYDSYFDGLDREDQDDQHIITRVVGLDHPDYWDHRDGIYWFHTVKTSGLESNAKIVTFAGNGRGPLKADTPKWALDAYR